MGMYTELAINVRFKEGTPKAFTDLLKRLCRHESDDEIALSEVPEAFRSHPFFATERWAWCLTSGGSYYFTSNKTRQWFDADKIDKSVGGLMVWTDIKNYSDEWETFLDFIAPHVAGSDYIGHYRYEEADFPTLLYVKDGKPIKYTPTTTYADELKGPLTYELGAPA